MAEKMLRQIICETIHPEYQQRIDGCYECGEAERIADSILVSISDRIKAKALTDEQMLNAYYDNYSMENFNKSIKAVAAAQLQAVLDLFDSLNVKGIK